MTAYLGAVLSSTAPAALVESGSVPGDRAFGAVTESDLLSWLGHDDITDASGVGYGNLEMIAATNEVRVRVPANEQNGCQIWVNEPAGDDLWVGADVIAEAGHDWVISGKLMLGVASTPTPGGSTNYADGATFRTDWAQGDSAGPFFDIYYYPPRVSSDFGIHTTSATIVPTGTYFRMLCGISKTNDTMELWVDGVKVIDQAIDLAAVDSFDRGIIQVFFGGSGSSFIPTTTQYRRLKNFKMGTSRASVE